jgi:hypothetical protein
VPNKLRKMAESMALTEPIFLRNVVEGTTNLERSDEARRRARDRNILLSLDALNPIRCESEAHCEGTLRFDVVGKLLLAVNLMKELLDKCCLISFDKDTPKWS